MEKVKIKINRLPGQTWNRLGMNDAEVEGTPFEGELKTRIRSDGPFQVTEKEEAGVLETALGESFLELLKEKGQARVQTFETQPDDEQTLRMELSLDGGAACKQMEFHAGEGSKVTVFQYVTASEGAKEGRAGIRTLIRGEQGATVKLVQIFAAGEKAECLNDVGAFLKEGAFLEVDQIFLGGKRVISGTMAKLQGRKAAFASNVAYDLRDQEELDLNLIASHVGKKTEAEMDVKGVLRKGSKKLLRATVDFLTGCSGSVGKEAEEVLLMDEEVVNQTIPLILCGEEDVEGAHGASIGRIDEEHLFYLKSRGIPEDEIYQMLAGAKIEGALVKIGDGETTERVGEILQKRWNA